MTMQEADRATIARCSKDSLAGLKSFPEVVATLAAAGVSSYLADYRSGATTYYTDASDAVRSPLPDFGTPIAPDFDAPALRAAIRRAQSGEVWYPDFVKLSRAAGCVGYFVWIAGRHVSYLGRRGETHIEPFPGSPS